MKSVRRAVAVLAASVAFLTVAVTPDATAQSATNPATVRSTIITYTVYRDVVSTVVVDGPAVITMTNLAYRHPEQTQVTVVATAAGTYELRDLCKPIVLPHTWRVYIDGVLVAATSGLKCD